MPTPDLTGSPRLAGGGRVRARRGRFVPDVGAIERLANAVLSRADRRRAAAPRRFRHRRRALDGAGADPDLGDSGGGSDPAAVRRVDLRRQVFRSVPARSFGGASAGSASPAAQSRARAGAHQPDRRPRPGPRPLEPAADVYAARFRSSSRRLAARPDATAVPSSIPSRSFGGASAGQPAFRSASCATPRRDPDRGARAARRSLQRAGSARLRIRLRPASRRAFGHGCFSHVTAVAPPPRSAASSVDPRRSPIIAPRQVRAIRRAWTSRAPYERRRDAEGCAGRRHEPR